MTHKRRRAITDDDGEHIMAVYVAAEANGFEGADLSGLNAPLIKNLRGANFRGAILYWANLQGADLSGCNFENADLSGAVLKDAKLIGANLKHAKLGLDNLGGSTSLEGADFSEAQLHGADFCGATFDSRTRFPQGFRPEDLGCVYVEAD